MDFATCGRNQNFFGAENGQFGRLYSYASYTSRGQQHLLNLILSKLAVEPSLRIILILSNGWSNGISWDNPGPCLRLSDRGPQGSARASRAGERTRKQERGFLRL